MDADWDTEIQLRLEPFIEALGHKRGGGCALPLWRVNGSFSGRFAEIRNQLIGLRRNIPPFGEVGALEAHR